MDLPESGRIEDARAPLCARVRPEPIEAAEPRQYSQRDLDRGRALIHGFHVMRERQGGLTGFDAFKAGVEAYELRMAR